MVHISVERFLEQFTKEYAFLYENNDRVAGMAEAVKAFDSFVENNRDFVGEFVNYRGDFIASDREAAAFMFALDNVVS